ncbi:MAG: hypothetical protein CVV32_00010 [Methanomicrobiales archaeon HGW-Methanomicrobiales-3]|nr:MAG: hypothetical protein CVV32_00010 [Methanomicrobiales archaeon HGW-Methanomicrobiales-3]
MENKSCESAKIVVFRIYATNTYYHDPESSNEIIPIEPLCINAFPEDGYKLKCYFGKVPEDIISAKETVDGIDLIRFKATFGNSVDMSKSSEELLRDSIAEIRLHTDRFTKFKWYTTIVIEEKIDVHEYENFNLDTTAQYQKFLNHFKKGLKELPYTEIFDKVAFCLLKEFDNSFFSKQLVENYFFVVNETIFFRNPGIFSGIGDLSVGKKYESVDHEQLISVMRSALQNELLSKIVHWRMAMLNEKDKWKKFLFGFFCMEILTNETFKIFEKSQSETYLKESEGYDESKVTPLFDSNFEDTNRMTLAIKFCFIAGTLNPEHYSDDVNDFIKCKKTRDDMSHGNILKVNELPFNELNRILDFYTTEILKHI